VSDRRSHLILVALILLALAGSAALIAPQSPVSKEVTLGLDLQGGLEVTLQAVPQEGHEFTEEDLDRSVGIMRDRVDKLGVSEPEIRKQVPDQIVISLPGIEDPERAAGVIGQTAQLELYDLETSLTGPSVNAQGFPVAQPTLYELLASAATQTLAREGKPGPFYLFEVESKRRLAGPLPTREAILATEAAQDLGDEEEEEAEEDGGAAGQEGDGGEAGGGEGGAGGGSEGAEGEEGEAAQEGEGAEGEGAAASDADLPEGYVITGVPENTVVITCGRSAVVCPGVGEPGRNTFFYLFKHEIGPDVEEPIPQMTGDHLELSGTRQDFDTSPGGGGGPIVLMQFTDEGADIFHDITRQEASRGQFRYNQFGAAEGADRQGFFQHFAIVLDREIKSFPSIDFVQYPDGISGSNGAQITGIGSVQEAQELALVLQTGALPVQFQTLEQTQISATLGEDSLRQALRAGVAGLILTGLFLLVLYRFLGLVAVIGLGIYAVFLTAAILLFGVTLTLPGFAGMILTIGVAADANIVIFERIKEEFRTGKSIRAAISSGYAKGFHTIVDANVVTAITALVLFTLATAGVKGFALMLLVGISISMVTAVFATRAMLGLLAGFRWFSNARFLGAAGKQRGTFLNIDFVGRRRTWFALSGALFAIGIGSLALQGLNLGIEFRGGTSISFTTPEPVALEDVRAEAARLDRGDAVVLGRGEPVGPRTYREFVIRTQPLSTAEQQQLTRRLSQSFEADSSVNTVSGSFGRQIAESAILAILISFALIIAYISFRFSWKFSLPVIVAMLHDVLITVGVYSLTGRQVTTATVAAVLTVLGYSVYDTIIIFDRVRENIPLMRRAPFQTITNVSLWETIRRSLATTFSTLLPVGALFFFGGETLRDFAFALLVGIAAGSYSSIFIAAPLLSILKEKEPEFARRSDGAAATTKEGREALLEQAEDLAADEPVPALAPLTPSERVETNDAKRERRRQRRRARPHGRAR
jgi:SecD/SecF fusion protein